MWFQRLTAIPAIAPVDKELPDEDELGEPVEPVFVPLPLEWYEKALERQDA